MQKLTKPSSGYIAIEADGSPVALEFGGGNASLQKDGDNLVFAFEDGTSSIVQDFYKNGKDATFIIDGQEIPAQALFEAMNASDIMPAAGGESQSATAGPKNHHGASYDEAALLAGTWSLRELDIRFDSASQETDTLQTAGGYGADRDGDDSGSTAEPEPTPVPEPTPEPKPYEASAHLEIPAVFEGQAIVGKISVDNPPLQDCIVQVRIGDIVIDVPLAANAAEAEFTVENPNREDPFIDASTLEVQIVSVTGGGYDAVDLEEPASVDILDTIDKVTFSITGESVDETAETVRFTITSDDPVQTGVLTAEANIDGKEYSVEMHWTDDGWVGYVDVPVRENDLLINGKDTIEAFVASAKHDSYEWENPDYGDKTEAAIVDNKDEAVFNTAISAADGQYIVEVTSVQPNSADSHPSLTLTVNGEERQIDLHWDDARDLWAESVAYDLPEADHADKTLHVEASVSNPSMGGLEYENPVCNPAVTDIFIEHMPWPLNASLDIPPVFEGNEIIGTLILDNAPLEDCIATVKVGDALVEVPVPAGASEVEFTAENPNTEDPFIDASSIEASILSIDGGGYDSVSFEDAVTVDILDTIDTVTFSITGEDVDETAETVRFTVTSDDPVKTGTLTVQASIGGEEYPVEMHWTDDGWVGHVDVPVRENDLLINGEDVIEAYIASAQHDSYEWENPDYGDETEASIIDNMDDAVFNTSISVADGQYIVEVTSVQPNSEDSHPSLTLTVNGEDRQIDLHWDDARGLWTESVAYSLPAPGAEEETLHIEASISNPSMAGLEYENPICRNAETDVTIKPAIDPFTPDPLAFTVDEAYLASGSKHGLGNGFADEAFLGGYDADSISYSLAFDSSATPLTAVVAGLERPVVLQMKEDGSVAGVVQVNALRTDEVFTVSVDADGNAQVELKDGISIYHSAAKGEGENVEFSGIKAVMTADGETFERPLSITFIDDAPYLQGDGEERTARIVPVESQSSNLLDCGPAMDFTMGSAGARFQNGVKGVQHWAAEGVTLSAKIVQLDEYGRVALDVLEPRDALEGKTHYLAYSGHNSNNAKPWNWGLNVKSASKWEHGKEISYDIQEHQAQAVMIDLGGKVAYGITVEFGAVYDPTSSVMANDRLYPEAAMIIFYRNGEMIDQEIASGLSGGEEARTFSAAASGGFDAVVISALDNGSLDPNPRNIYKYVSDNDFTIRAVDFETHPRTEPIHSVEGDLLLSSGADGISMAQKSVVFDADVMGTGFDAVYADGSKHTVSYEFTAGGTCLTATDEDGTLVFNAVVGGDGIWKADIHTVFTKDGTEADESGTSWLTLAFKTGDDADGDYASATMEMPSAWQDESAPVSVDVVIEANDHTVAGDAALVHAGIDVSLLGDGSSVEITANSHTHVLEWNGSGFDCETLDFAWQNGEISWVETMPPAGTMLQVQVVQKWITDTGLELEAFGEDNAQRELDVYGQPVSSGDSVPTLADYLASIADVSTGDIPDIPGTDGGVGDSAPPVATAGSSQADIPDSYADTGMPQDIDPIVLAMQNGIG